MALDPLDERACVAAHGSSSLQQRIRWRMSFEPLQPRPRLGQVHALVNVLSGHTNRLNRCLAEIDLLRYRLEPVASENARRPLQRLAVSTQREQPAVRSGETHPLTSSQSRGERDPSASPTIT